MRYHVKNWGTFQHYKDRRPPWIKLHRTILDDCDFLRLHVASRALAPLIWLLASESADGSFEGDVTGLSFRLRIDAKEIKQGLTGLLEIGYITQSCDAIAALASRKQEARPEAEAEAEKRQRKDRAEAEVKGDYAKSISLSSLPLPALPIKTPTDRPPRPAPSLGGMSALEAVRFAVGSSKTKAQPQLEAIAQSKPVEKVIAAMEQVYHARCEGRIQNPGGLANKLLQEIQ